MKTKHVFNSLIVLVFKIMSDNYMNLESICVEDIEACMHILFMCTHEQITIHMYTELAKTLFPYLSSK